MTLDACADCADDTHDHVIPPITGAPEPLPLSPEPAPCPKREFDLVMLSLVIVVGLIGNVLALAAAYWNGLI